ncbi:hypothetical protein CQ018_01270 [Arthrobacter sp. MYb227]|uniref:4a-hydroxytetrahydrobiopterin dehydratase n=1 Tax=Arthrobacter sp. MYb227 TaxID=1848601 RepID=UPI000CFA8D37|nr:4a-hydroxytetrahydrobiopterin dehydratase [Arthrobacter sp. MYb227]PQZ95950.1 hypothetical protein CQ018_01270 [Arthrobacter sp. MYb227]
MDSNNRVLDNYEISRALKNMPSWHQRHGSLICAWSFATSREAVDFLGIIAEAAELHAHHPDVDWRYNTIFLTLSSHDAGSEITARDLYLAALLEVAAADSGALAVPHRHQDLNLCLETQDPEALAGFWVQSLGYRQGRDGDLVDPERRNPSLWFAQVPDATAGRIGVERLVARSEFAAAHSKLEQVIGAGDDSYAQDAVAYLDGQGNRVLLSAEPELPGQPQEF